jgi:hypothetical protein
VGRVWGARRRGAPSLTPAAPYPPTLGSDDFWCSTLLNGTCTDPAQGPTEMEIHAVADMGLSDEDVRDITLGWLAGMTAAQEAILARGKYTWSLIPGQDNADASPVVVTQTSCAARMAAACAPTNEYLSAPLLHGVAFNAAGDLANVDADIAAFLLMRGPWAWTGAGVWGMSWPMGRTWNSSNTPRPRPPQMDEDYGAPLDAHCLPGAAPGVFTRRYEHALVTLDCASYTGNITML